MDNIKIWHNPRCRKSREGLQYLRDKGIEPEIFDYLKEGIDADDLIRVIKMTGQAVTDFIRTNEAEYKELGLKGKELSIEEFAHIAAKHPRLLQRPIVVQGNKAVMGQPANKIAEIL
jgi:arsenate reductase (glutaredoxin)